MSYPPYRIFLELSGLTDDEINVVFANHFSDITFPALYLAPGGGSGCYANCPNK